MRGFRRILYAAFLLVLGLAVVLFLLENRQTTSVLFLGWAAPELPISALLIIALLSGMAVSPLLVWFKVRLGRTAGRSK